MPTSYGRRLQIGLGAAIVLGSVATNASAADCYERSMGVTSKLLACGQVDLEEADAALNAAWKNLRAKARRRDRQAVDGWSMADALLRAQRAWLTYRDNHCEAEVGGERGVSMGAIIHQGCLIVVTQERTKELRSLAGSPHMDF